MEASNQRPQGLIQPLPVPSGPWASFVLDFITDLPRAAGMMSINTVVDFVTIMAHLLPLSGAPSALAVARFFIAQVFHLHSLPYQMISDRGWGLVERQFMARFWRNNVWSFKYTCG